MGIKAIQQLQGLSQEANVENQSAAREKVQAVAQDQKAISKEMYEDQIKQMENEKGAADTKSDATCWFAIFLGPLIGTAIGNAVGGEMASGDDRRGNEYKKQVGQDDLSSQHLDDDFTDARKNLDEQAKQGSDLAKFTRELRDDKWTGL